jgi:hypothetical protein
MLATRRPLTSLAAPIAAVVLSVQGMAWADPPSPTSSTAPPPTEASYAPPVAPAPQQPAASSGLSTEQIGALVGLGVGVLGVGFGVGWGIATISQKNDAQQVCPTQVVCFTQNGVNKWQSADNNGTLSTFAFVIGAAGLLEAAVLWWLPTSSDPGSPKVGLGPGGLRVRGTW